MYTYSSVLINWLWMKLGMKREALICGTCQLPWCNCYHHSYNQITNDLGLHNS